jgi:hypothetical protein
LGQNFPWNSPKPQGQRGLFQPSLAYNTNAATANATLPAANLTGGAVEVDLALTGTLAGAATATTDTAANIIAAMPRAQSYTGFTYKLRIINASSANFAWTLSGGSGVTITGTATIAQNTWRDYIVTLTLGSSPAVTMRECGSGSV